MGGGHTGFLGNFGRVLLTFSPFSPRSPRCPCSPAGPCRGRGGEGWRGVRNPLPLPLPHAPDPLPQKFQKFPGPELLPPAGPGVLGVLRPAGTQMGGDIRAGRVPAPFWDVPTPPPGPALFWGVPPPTHIFDVTGFTFLSLRGKAKGETPKRPKIPFSDPTKAPKPPQNSFL